MLFLANFKHRSPQEEAFASASSSKRQSESPYKPIGLASKLLTLEVIQKVRREDGVFLNPNLGILLSLPGRAAISYAELDPVTGEALEDPKIIGYYDDKKKTLVRIGGDELTKKAYELLRKMEEKDPEVKYFLRETKIDKEKEQPNSGGIESEK